MPLTPPGAASSLGRAEQSMNTKLLLRMLFLIAVLLLLVLMGMNNRQSVQLSMSPLFDKTPKVPAALMYFGFFALGVVSGAMIVAGKKGGSAGKAKPAK